MTEYTTGTAALPYPEGTNKVAVAADIRALAIGADMAIAKEGTRAEDAAKGHANGKAFFRGTAEAADSNIDQWFTSAKNGNWLIVFTRVNEAGGTNPAGNYSYFLEHITGTSGGTVQTAKVAHAAHPYIYYRAETTFNSKVFGPWNRMGESEATAPSEMSTASMRHAMLEQDMAAYRGGKVDTKGAAPVALIWDDFPADFRDRVLPLLVARNIPSTLAIGSRILTEPYRTSLGGGDVTWAQINSWTTTSRVEVANHGATHGDRITSAGIYDEVVTGLAELKANLPARPIYGWVQPAAVYDPGFNNGTTLDSYASTYAGNLIMAHHGIATGSREPNGELSVPRRGQPIQGMRRIWIDQGTTNVQNIVSGLQAKKHGVLIGSHANRYGLPGNTTMEQLTAFLDWLVVEQTAGRVRLLTLSEWAVADVG